MSILTQLILGEAWGLGRLGEAWEGLGRLGEALGSFGSINVNLGVTFGRLWETLGDSGGGFGETL